MHDGNVYMMVGGHGMAFGSGRLLRDCCYGRDCVFQVFEDATTYDHARPEPRCKTRDSDQAPTVKPDMMKRTLVH